MSANQTKTQMSFENLDEAERNAIVFAMQAEYTNGFGFQFDDADMSFIIALFGPRDYEKADANFNDTVQSTAKAIAPKSKCGDFIGRHYLQVDVSEYEMIPAVLNAILQLPNLWIKPQTHLPVRFFSGDIFSRAEMERRAIEWCKETYQDDGGLRYEHAVESVFQLKKNWNWQTPEGKAFCRHLRQAVGKPHSAKSTKCRYTWPNFERVCRKYRLLHCSVWNAYIPSGGSMQDFLSTTQPEKQSNEITESPIESNEKRQKTESAEKSEDEDDGMCLVCYENVADTLVVPCMHQVVCCLCSDKLENTADKHRCIRCRQLIKEIYRDEK